MRRDEAQRLGVDEVISIPSYGRLFTDVRKGGTLISSVSVPDAHLAQQCGIEAKFILVDVNTEDLEAVADILDAQRIVVRIGQVLPLRDAGR